MVEQRTKCIGHSHDCCNKPLEGSMYCRECEEICFKIMGDYDNQLARDVAKLKKILKEPDYE